MTTNVSRLTPANPFKQASKKASRLRMALVGTSGSGKTWTALTLGCRLAEAAGGRVALIDTESGSASLYADHFDFDALNLESFSPQSYIDAIHAAEAAGYPVIIIDSLSHAWSGKDGALELVDRAQKQGRASGAGGNSFTAWRDVTPLHNQMIDAIVGSRAHVIATMRAKTEYVMEKDERGKSVPRKVGMAPVQRDGLEYEFTVVGTMDAETNALSISKSRLADLSGAFIIKPTAGLADRILEWLDGTPAEAVTETPPRPQPRPAPPDDEPPAPPDQDSARRAFYGACSRRDLCLRNDADGTRKLVNGALGLPPVEGVLPAVARDYGWDFLRQHIEDADSLPDDVTAPYWEAAMPHDPAADQPDAEAAEWTAEFAPGKAPVAAGSVRDRGSH